MKAVLRRPIKKNGPDFLSEVPRLCPPPVDSTECWLIRWHASALIYIIEFQSTFKQKTRGASFSACSGGPIMSTDRASLSMFAAARYRDFPATAVPWQVLSLANDDLLHPLQPATWLIALIGRRVSPISHLQSMRHKTIFFCAVIPGLKRG